MGISVKWGNEDQTLIILEFESGWTWDDLYQAAEQMHQLLDTVDHAVDTITDLRNSRGLPSGFIGHATRLTSRRHPNSRMGVVVGANRLIEMAVDIARKVHPGAAQNLVFADTIEEAHALITESRSAEAE